VAHYVLFWWFRELQQARSIVDQSSAKLAEEAKARVAASFSLRAEQAAAAADGDRLKAQVEELKRCVCVCGCHCDPSVPAVGRCDGSLATTSL
jgi:hypothetical protein